MTRKVCSTIQEALADVHDGSSIMVGGISLWEAPYSLVRGSAEKGVKDLTFICIGYNSLIELPDGSQVKKLIASFGVTPYRHLEILIRLNRGSNRAE